MKKRILSILLTLCMVLMLVPTTVFADENYMITQNFKYGTRTYDGTDPQTSPYQFVIPAGGSFGLATIEDCSPYKLVGWKESVSGTVYPPYAEIQNLQSDLTFDAVYQVQGGLAIKIDGFMPGKKVGDCTVTVESTIPGVTFSETDIRDFSFFGSEGPMGSTDVFEAGTRYKLDISLDNKGLELTPSTTVNGIAPTLCRIAYDNNVPYAIGIICDLGTPMAPTLAVTVDNFEVGKTPADITYSFASTNLDVTFSEEDILANTGSWKYYHGDVEEWLPMRNTEVFEAGTRYLCTINLDNKGLTVAPAVTMNGKTPEVCYLATRNGVPCAIVIGCDLGTPAPAAITIDGPGVVCAEQDYEFSVTASEGAEALYFLYRCGEFGGDTGWDRTDGGVCYGTVPASDYGDADTLELTVYGTAANGKPATATKTVQILKEHRFVDGVCGCGAKSEYTITYDGGADFGLWMDVKTHGVDLTLAGKGFYREGLVHTGWMGSDGVSYELGGVYSTDADVTLYPVYDQLITLNVPFTTTVKLGGDAAPGETTFDLALIGSSAGDMDTSDVTVSGSVTTNGAGDYDGELTITGPSQQLWYMLSEGAFVQQVDGGEDGWTYDDTVWGLLLTQATYSTADAAEFAVLVLPALCEETDDGVRYDIDWEAIDWENLQSEDMHFTNIYTKSTTEPGTPKTGDNSNFALWLALFAVSAAGVIGTGVYSRRRRSTK